MELRDVAKAVRADAGAFNWYLVRGDANGASEAFRRRRRELGGDEEIVGVRRGVFSGFCAWVSGAARFGA